MSLQKLAGVLSLSWLLAQPANGQVVQYDISDARGAELPAKLTFLTRDGKVPERIDIKSRVPEFAARKNVVYELYGKGEIPLPAGDYQVYVSRGLEWSNAVLDIQVSAQRPAPVKAALERVVDTRGWLSGDLHLHTKTFSGHGDANVEERLITLCAENLEWAVATDHNHITDYRPYARRLGTDRWMTTSIGNEVTTGIGHFNTFPLDPSLPPVNHRIHDPRELFRKIRENPLDEIIQINHPRWVGVNGGYFRDVDLFFTTGDTLDKRFSYDFDCLEVLNDNSMSGWELRLLPTKEEPPFDHSVREDWFNLLNRGYSFAGVGNSDSHEVDVTVGACPRNYLRSGTDDPLRAAEADLTGAIRTKQVTVSSGIFITMTAGGMGPGSRISSKGGEVRLEIKVQAAPWVDADRLVVIGNGEPVYVAELAGSAPSVAKSTAGRPVVRFNDTVKVRPQVDTWYVAYAEGDEPPYPMLHKITVPIGFTNPIWVEADGDGRFVSLRDRAAAAVGKWQGSARLEPGELTDRLAGQGPVFRRHAVGVLAGMRAGEAATDPLSELLLDPDARVREAAANALARIGGQRALLSLLQGRDAARTRWERFLFDRELVVAGDHSALLDLQPDYASAQGLELFQMRRDLKELCRKNRIEKWWVVGPFPARGVESGLNADYPPDREILFQRRYAAFERKPARWKKASTDSSHYLNLREAFNPNERAAAYAYVIVRAPKPVRTCLLLGSRCGLEIRLNGSRLYRQLRRESSSPASQMVPAQFRAGENRLLVKAVVERGEWGFSLMVPEGAGLEFSTGEEPAHPSQSF